MRNYIVFIKKEFIEYLRTYKLMIMLIVFVLLGIISPLFAKLTPLILEMSGIDASAMPDLFAEPDAIASWIQFFSNIGQMGVLCFIIVFSGIFANELTKGTLINVLTKGLSRATIIFSKFTAAVFIWTLSYAVSILVCYLYTEFYWQTPKFNHIFLSFFSFWLYGILLLNLLILGGIIFKNIIGSLMLTGGAVVVMMIINISPKMLKYNPITLASNNIELLTGVRPLSDFIPSLLICGGSIIISLTASVIIFNKKQV